MKFALFAIVIGLTLQIKSFSQSGWIEVYSGPYNIRDIFFINNSIGIAVGEIGPEATIIKTTDGGYSWQEKFRDPNELSINSIFMDSQFSLAVAYGTIYRSSDNGETWVKVLQNNALVLGDVFIRREGTSVTCWAISFNKILVSNDTGLNWIVYNLPDGFDPEKIFFYNNTNGWIAGWGNTGGKIIETLDGGISWWRETNFGIHVIPFSLAFGDWNHGYAVGLHAGLGGWIAKTTDSGWTWTEQIIGYQDYQDVYFVNSMVGWAVGGAGTIIKTTNGGNSWVEQESGTWYDLNTIFAIDINNAWIGGYGFVLKTTNGGVTSVENDYNVSLTLSLDQNFPNPFNSSTFIKYQLPDAQYISLKVYDVLGNEVATLVNEEKNAGNYEVEFNPTDGSLNLASGIYLYRLQAGDYVLTKKMILLK